METGTILSLGLYFIVMLAIGLYGYKTSTDDVSGYMLGGRKLSPSVTALSAGASDMSGWMLMGLPGAMYISGLSSTWIAVGLLIGAYLNYLVVAPRLRVYTEIAQDAITIPDYFEKRFADKTRLLRVVSSIVIVIFFTLYSASSIIKEEQDLEQQRSNINLAAPSVSPLMPCSAVTTTLKMNTMLLLTLLRAAVL